MNLPRKQHTKSIPYPKRMEIMEATIEQAKAYLFHFWLSSLRALSISLECMDEMLGGLILSSREKENKSTTNGIVCNGLMHSYL